MSEVRGLPKPVRQALVGKPLHPQCQSGDPAITCADCTGYIMEAFDTVYGSLPSGEAVLAAILDDLAAEEAERTEPA